MGVFLLRQVDRETGVELTRCAAPNVLAYEGLPHLLHQLFPPYDAAPAFELGISGATTAYPHGRPNPGGGAVFGPDLTFADCTGPGANEGGGYTDAMRAALGYERHAVGFTVSREADGGALVAPEVAFSNDQTWTPQDASAWDRPWTADEIEQPPPEWSPKESWEPTVGYPWQRPRKRCGKTCNPADPNECLEAFMHAWDSSGALNWLCDFRKLGGFPITLAFLADSTRSKLIAAAQFRAPVLLRPGTSLHVRYQARVYGQVTADFAVRLAQAAFTTTAARYDAIYARPLLDSAPRITRRTRYADLAPHLPPAFPALALSHWSDVAGPPPALVSVTVPTWQNPTTAAIGPLNGLAVFGAVGGAYELMWVTPVDPPVTVAAGAALRVPDGVRFVLEGV